MRLRKTQPANDWERREFTRAVNPLKMKSALQRLR
jgi:hypothetical protein